MSARILLIALLVLAATPLQAQQYRSQLVEEGDLLDSVPPPTIESLEQNLGALIDPLEKANTQRYLAQQFIAQKQYDKAIGYYEQALASPATEKAARQQMLGELASLYVVTGKHSQAADVLERYRQQGGREHGDLEFAIAQRLHQQGDHARAASSYDRGLSRVGAPSAEQLRTALALNYRAGRLPRCTELLQRLLRLEPDRIEHWRNITALFMQLKDNRSALDHWLLAFEKRLPLTERDLLLLTDLLATERNPDRAARLLEAAIKGGHVRGDTRNYQRLATYWQRAGRTELAAVATERATRQSDDPELKLYLARLHMEKEEWQAMQDKVLDACSKPLPRKLVSRANLLLGISQVKLGDAAAARRSLINATIYGGATDEAGKWLRYLKAEPASRRESLGVSGPCSD